LVEKQRVEDPSGARVRVMTVHQSKGLQFDVVVLPNLYPSLEKSGDRSPVVPLRDGSTGRVVKIYPATDKTTRILLPELRMPHEQARAFRLRDELSALYVAMTRARYALHLVVPADGPNGPGTTKSPARLLRDALAPGEPAEDVGGALYHHGDPDWFQGLRTRDFSGATSASGGVTSELSSAVLMKTPTGARLRNLARRSPSGLEGGEALDLAAHMRLDLKGDARLRGTVVHAWCEEVEWLDHTLPGGAPSGNAAFDEAACLTRARKVAPGLSDDRLREWLAEYQGWMTAEAVRKALSRSAYPPGARVERELPFLHRIPDGILQGFIDRLVLIEKDGRVVAAEVLDFKTDYIDESDPRALEDRIAYYRPQIDAYRTAVAGRYGLSPKDISGKLLFLRLGVVREI
jgi:ATP-dependent exoDNAse (exonuclease V) beta subunit